MPLRACEPSSLPTTWRMSCGARNWPFFTLTGLPVLRGRHEQVGLAAQKRRNLQDVHDCRRRRGVRGLVNVGEHRQAGARFDVGRACAGPASRPGPRNDDSDVRLALSYDALKIERHAEPRADLGAAPIAVSMACASLSMTHGPTMKASGWPVPIVTAPAETRRSTGVHHASDVGVERLALRGDLLLIGGADEAGKERMRLERPRLELGMELHGDEPRMAGQLGNLDELAVGRSAGDAHAFSRSVGSYRQLNSKRCR